MTSGKQYLNIFFLALLSVGASFAAGYIVRGYFSPAQVEFPVMNEAYEILVNHGLQPLPASPAMEYGMIHGMVSAYGEPHTSFLEPVQTELESNSLRGSFGGIGVRIGKDAEGYYVIYPFQDGPAAQAGLQEGDRLIMVDTLEVTPTTPSDQLQAAIRGPSGTTVTVIAGRPPAYEPASYTIKRLEIPLPSVTWHLEPSEPRLGMIEVNLIASSTPGEIEKAIEDLQGRGATHFALDLRNNGGGLLQEGVKVARLFLASGVVMEQQYRDQGVETFKVDQPGPYAEIPLVVLVNENTASASEIIAGSLQANQRAILVGRPTYGKNTIQLVFTLRDKSSLHVTAAKWWIPGLEFPKGEEGLIPEVTLPEGETGSQAAIQAAIAVLFGGQ